VPLRSSFVAASIFVFTSIIFLVYDGWVEKRQRQLYHAALRSSAFISSLFPTNVRDRLLHDGESDTSNRIKDHDSNHKKGNSLHCMVSINHHLRQWYFENNNSHNVNPVMNSKEIVSSKPSHGSMTTISETARTFTAGGSPPPIADLFASATGKEILNHVSLVAWDEMTANILFFVVNKSPFC
jgi:hypothetical protein